MSSSTYIPHCNHSGQDSLTRIFFRAPTFRSGLEARSNKNSNTNPVSTKCRLQTGYKIQTADWVKKCKLRIYTVFSSDTWITCHFITYRESRNRFSAIIFHDYLHYRGVFLARFLINIVLNIISSPHIVFSLCAQVSCWDVGTEFTNLIKVDVDGDVKEMSLLNIRYAQYSRNNSVTALHVVRTFHRFNRYVFILLTKMQTETKTVPSTWYILKLSGVYTHWFFHMCPILLLA